MSRSRELPWSLRTVKSFTRREADKRGVHWRRLAADDLERPFHGVRRLAGSDQSVRELAEAYAKRMPKRQVFSHETAAALWGMPLPASEGMPTVSPAPAAGDSPAAEPAPSDTALRITEPPSSDGVVKPAPRLHVSVPRGSAPPTARGVVGHVLRFERLTIYVHGGLRVVDPASAWVQCAARLSLDDLAAAADFLLTGTQPLDGRAPRCTRDDLAAAIERHAGCRGATLLRQALELARSGPLSRRESLLRLDLLRGGLPEPECNHRVLGPDGSLVAMIDLAYPSYRVGLEYQSDLHRPAAAFRRDIGRLERLSDVDWMIVQVTSDDVSADGAVRNSAALQERVARRLRARGWRPGTS
ncbi:hypothetical protein [Agromyces bauzanensis]|uniref:hypothetical protein n=1 Tax=Agromyces bauzanensis TaxID=1308924 RepID=UPI001665D866|nr:hypothetical protein [Agromyces bauzanensis]